MKPCICPYQRLVCMLTERAWRWLLRQSTLSRFPEQILAIKRGQYKSNGRITLSRELAYEGVARHITRFTPCTRRSGYRIFSPSRIGYNFHQSICLVPAFPTKARINRFKPTVPLVHAPPPTSNTTELIPVFTAFAKVLPSVISPTIIVTLGCSDRLFDSFFGERT